MKNLTGKCVLLGITGGIAAYKMANVASALHKAGAKVHVIMTENATKFITPLTFETLTGSKCMVDTFDRDFQFDVRHISVAKEADVILVAPATADIIAKMAHGIADDMLSTVVLAATCRKLVSPSMNTAMLENPITQDNISTLRRYGFTIIDSASGYLACGDTGSGKLPEPEVLCRWIEREIAYMDKPWQGKKVVVTAGPTQEALDPVRYLTNHSTGKMGYALAHEAMLRGADVTLVSGPVALEPVPFVKQRNIVSAADMFEAIREELPDTDVLIKAAAVADYRPAVVADQKIKKGMADQAGKPAAGPISGSEETGMSIPLSRTQDILGWVAQNHHPGLVVCGFSMETENLLANSSKKLTKKKLDMIVANSLRTAGAGFGTDTNVVTLITKDGAKELPLMSKDDVAARILDRIRELMDSREQD
ncbi:MAG: bifunctional phosphopantothenoylcysteine decarboxylase/phosphopantothenate--cysteine ligase CoaBC [Eubacteriales bacterium]|nr:bifunctional phosphopantothenoylcysteine decarboxylase/phosphopantothenate--cysteine ligase CoaBC [Lachnospiraceae bacterium]MDO4417117.1 bifunctional phosphopantothenoylcysteine decarboxylase/phosphopantothenate--cysteine ligase CoaBC [Eubacteriales bacterium]